MYYISDKLKIQAAQAIDENTGHRCNARKNKKQIAMKTFANNVLPTVALDGFREVSKEEFYDVVGAVDAVLTISNDYPYTITFKKRGGGIIGKSVDSYKGKSKYPIVTRYYISCNWR